MLQSMSYLLLIGICTLGLTTTSAQVLASQAHSKGTPSVNLVMSDEYLITHAIGKSKAGGKQAEDVIAFQNKAWEINKKEYNELRKLAFLNPDIIASSDFHKRFADYFNTLLVTPEYLKIKNQTLDYMNESLKEWNLNLERSTAIISRYSGFSDIGKFKVYITHPALGNGRFHREAGNVISFGAWPTFKNYFTVYIWHEMIHSFMKSDDKSHAANQLLTDNELRAQLNKEAFEPLQGHKELIPLMKRNLKKWEKYKTNPTNLNDFVGQMTP
ncbi:hypothetical protein K2P97_09565 [bacterium]|nr:hypothetical protein [bacterium]